MLPPEGWVLWHQRKVVDDPASKFVVSLLVQNGWEIYIKSRMKQGR